MGLARGGNCGIDRGGKVRWNGFGVWFGVGEHVGEKRGSGGGIAQEFGFLRGEGETMGQSGGCRRFGGLGNK